MSSAGRQIAIVCLVGWAVGTEYTSHASLFPVLMPIHGFGPAGAAALSAIFVAVLAVSSLPFGQVVDRFGPRRVAAAGLGVLLVGNVLFASADGLVALTLAKTVAGLGGSAAFICGVRYADVTLEDTRSFWVQGLFGGSTQLGAAWGLYVPPLIYAAWGWRAVYLVQAVGAGVVGLAWLSWSKPTPARARRVGLRHVVTHASLWLLALVYTEMFGLAFVLGNWTSTMFVHDWRISIVLAGTLGSTFLLVGIVARPLGGVLVSRSMIGPRRLIVLSLLTSGIALAIMSAYAVPLAGMVALLVLIGIAANLPYAGIMGSISSLVPAAPGAAVGVVNTVTLSLMSLQTFAVGRLFKLTGNFRLALLVLAGVTLTAILAAVPLPRGSD